MLDKLHDWFLRLPRIQPRARKTALRVVDTALDRALTEQERGLVEWLLLHGESRAASFLPQLSRAWVVARCPCGCASIDFSINGVRPSPKSGMDVVSDHWWRTAEGHICGIFVFLRDGLLAGFEVWSVDGLSPAAALPDVGSLRPLDEPFGSGGGL